MGAAGGESGGTGGHLTEEAFRQSPSAAAMTGWVWAGWRRRASTAGHLHGAHVCRGTPGGEGPHVTDGSREGASTWVRGRAVLPASLWKCICLGNFVFVCCLPPYPREVSQRYEPGDLRFCPGRKISHSRVLGHTQVTDGVKWDWRQSAWTRRA